MPKKIYKTVLFVLLILDLFFLSAVASYRITISGEMVTIPNLIGQTVEDVKSDLAEKKLTVVQSGYRLHQHIERGKIAFQDPPAGSKLKLNGVVKVVLSAGKEKVTVPLLAGRMEREISPILREVGLRKGKISHIFTPKRAAGRIVAQYPLVDQEVGRDSRVSLLVSQGRNEEKYLMPDLLGRRADSTIAWLESLEFRLGPIRREFYRGLDPGIIINQYPLQGFPVTKRSLITLEVSK
jgi:serine/threonine-protein kinase